MSMLSEQVNELRELADGYKLADKPLVARTLHQAADTIEDLSRKLEKEKINRNAAQYAREEVVKKLKEISNGSLPETRPYIYLNTAIEIIRDFGDIWFPGYYKDNWILCSNQMPKETVLCFVDKHCRRIMRSNDVIATIVWENGRIETELQYTIEGKWLAETRFQGCKVVAWQPFPEPYHKP